MNWKIAALVVLVPCLLGVGGAIYYVGVLHHFETDTGSQHPGVPGDDANNTSPNTSPTNPGGPSGPNASPSSPTNLAELVNASNNFALEMYSNLTNAKDNLFFSPYSIFTALGMTYEGARNKTAEEMRSVFHFPADNETRWALFKALIEKLNANDTGCNLSTANALWIRDDFTVREAFLNAVCSNYLAEIQNVNFGDEAACEAARLRINYWVENQTNGKIKDLIPKGILDSLTLMVLTNAIYFKGNWLKQFNASLTEDRDFHTGSGAAVKAKMMARTDEESKFNYTSVDGVQVLEMPYAGEKLSMLVLLPKAGSMESLEKALTLQKLSEWRGKLEEQRVDVYFPKFELNTKYFLKENLSDMGMPSAFTGACDLSGIYGDFPGMIYIKDVIHQGFVSVDESGTEAAAATAVVVELRGPVEPVTPVFNADHPFIFLIQERDSGNILFMGKLADPTA